MAGDAVEGDASLLRRYREGDEEAFRALFERHVALLESRIGRRLPRHLRRRLDVSDVLQETRIVAFQRRHDVELRDREAFGSWLLGVVDMKLREAIRRHDLTLKRSAHREVTRSRRLDTAQFSGDDPSPSEAAASSEFAERARRTLDRLPHDYREVLRLVREEGLTLGEAAGRMGRSPEAVRKLCGRAICRFKQLFERQDGRHDDGR